MGKIRVEQLTFRNQVRDSATVKDREQRLHLFANSGFENQRKTFAGIGKRDLSALTGSNKDGSGHQRAHQPQNAEEIITIRFKDGERVEFPRLRPEIRERAEFILTNIKPEEREQLGEAMFETGVQTWGETLENPDGSNLESTAALQSAGNETYEGYMTSGFQSEQNEYEQDALFMGMYGAHDALNSYFQEVQGNQQTASEVRTDIADIEAALTDWPDDGSTESFDYREVIYGDDGSINVVEHRDVEMTKEQAIALRDSLDSSLNGLSNFDTLQMANLQRMVNNYQQAMNTVSNIMKTSHDTQKAIIANARA